MKQKYSVERAAKSLIKRIIPEAYHSTLADCYVKCKYCVVKFACPFCGGHFRKLLPTGFYVPELKAKNIVGGGYRLNVKCPGCLSSDRERLIFLYLKYKTAVFSENLRLLHVAPERNLQKVFTTHPNIDYVSVDLNSPLAMVRMDITDIQYDNNWFDVIICNHVLEHIRDDRKAMSELFRVLKPGGWAILQVPISLALDRTLEDQGNRTPEEREKAFGQTDHVRIYGRDYRARLEKVGFSVEVYSFRKEFGWLATYKYALLKRENLYVCSKSRQGNFP